MTTSATGTRSSAKWRELPGNWDALNCHTLFPSTNQWGIPDLEASERRPARLVPYSARHLVAGAHQRADTAVHFFLDDYRFEVVWSKPNRGLLRPLTVGSALTPDFSVWTNMPRAMQIWQTYRSRWCGAWMAHHGVAVTPTVSWAGTDTYDFAFAGIARGSVVAVSTVGILNDAGSQALFRKGYAAMIEALDPPAVLIHGRAPARLVPDRSRVTTYPTRWDKD